MKPLNKKLIKKLKDISVILTDVDGVLTDGGMYYTADGLTMKKFNVKDGMAHVLLRKAGYKIGFVSSDGSTIARVRGERLSVDFIYTGALNKMEALDEICKIAQCDYANVAHIGDDVNDLEILQKVGFSACPADAVAQVKNIVHYVCKHKGGRGAYREVADLFLNVQCQTDE
jgi:YrbI family 3-deoxy-D-manno-octulosonate 8-phosphate phosphatase